MKRNLIGALVSLFLFVALANIPVGARTANAATELAAQAIAAQSKSGPFFLPWDSFTRDAFLAVDQAGGFHAAYSPASPDSSGAYWVYYASCVSNCTEASSWSAIKLDKVGLFGGQVTLALTSSGRPRLLWQRQTSALGDAAYVYAACDSQCGSNKSWRIASVSTGGTSVEPVRIVLDRQDRPRFIYTSTKSNHTGTYYAFCDARCTDAMNWREGQLSPAYMLYNFRLVFDSSDRARLAYDDATSGKHVIGYGECTSDCAEIGRWRFGFLTEYGSDGAFALRVDTSGHPRMAIYTGYLGAGQRNNVLDYAWCDTNCGNPQYWMGQTVGLPEEYGKDVDLVLDRQGQPHLAYRIAKPGGAGLGYSSCSSGCTSNSPTWKHALVDTDVALNASAPLPVKSGCALSWWHVGEKPSLALNTAGTLFVAYNTRHSQSSGCQFHYDLQLVRFASVGATKQR